MNSKPSRWSSTVPYAGGSVRGRDVLQVRASDKNLTIEYLWHGTRLVVRRDHVESLIESLISHCPGWRRMKVKTLTSGRSRRHAVLS